MARSGVYYTREFLIVVVIVGTRVVLVIFNAVLRQRVEVGSWCMNPWRQSLTICALTLTRGDIALCGDHNWVMARYHKYANWTERSRCVSCRSRYCMLITVLGLASSPRTAHWISRCEVFCFRFSLSVCLWDVWLCVSKMTEIRVSGKTSKSWGIEK